MILLGIGRHRKPHPIASDYLHGILDLERRGEVVDAAVRTLKDEQFDSLAFRGMSGALVAPIVAYILGKQVTAVRKPGDGTHSSLGAEGAFSGDRPMRWVFFDDFMASGNTLRETWKAIKRQDEAAVFAGAYLWNRDEFYAPANKELSDMIARWQAREAEDRQPPAGIMGYPVVQVDMARCSSSW